MFCKNCGNKLGSDDRVCAVCGETVDSGNQPGRGEVREKNMEKPMTEAKLAVDEDIKTPLFNFKWNVEDFPQDGSSRTEDIDFNWNESQRSMNHQSMNRDSMGGQSMGGQSMGRSSVESRPVERNYTDRNNMNQSDADAMFMFNKKNEEFQELLDREFEKYNRNKPEPPVDSHTRRYDPETFTPSNDYTPGGDNSQSGVAFASPFSAGAPSQGQEAPYTQTPEQQAQSQNQTGADMPAGPDRINMPVVFPFDLDKDNIDVSVPDSAAKEFESSAKEIDALKNVPDATQNKSDAAVSAVQKVVEEQRNAQAQNSNAANAATSAANAPAAPGIAKPDPTRPDTKVQTEIPGDGKKKKEGGGGLVKALIAVIIIIVILLAGIGVMKYLPQSMLGIALNNFSGMIFGTQSTEESKTLPPNDDMNALIKSQLNVNKNIKSVTYDESVRYDESVNYKISAANGSVPIENNFFKKGANGDLLFDEQAVRAVIGYNSAWVSHVNDGYNDVFGYVAEGSNAEKSLKKDKVKDGSNVAFDKLGIGEVRQNGNKFYVWTNETITIKNKGEKEKNATIKQLYELEVAEDSLKILNVVEL